MTLPLRRVVVHPDGAVVHREGPVPVVDGAVVVDGLPWLLDPASVRVEGAAVGEVEVDLDPSSLVPPGRPAAVDALAAATLAVARWAAEVEGCRAERGYLVRLLPGFVDEPDRARPTVETLRSWVRADAALEERLRALDERTAAAVRSHRDAEEERAALASRLAAESAEAAVRHWLPTRRVRARVSGEGPAHLAVSYVVPGAAWSPAYVLDAEPGLARGTFSLRALVVQATGEDWARVSLALSTAPVARRVDLPTLRSFRLAERQEGPPPAFRELPDDLDGMFPADAPTERGRVTRSPPAPPPPPAADADEVDLLVEQESNLVSELAPKAHPVRTASAERSAGPLSAVGGMVGGALDAVFGGGGAPAAAPARGRAAVPQQSGRQRAVTRARPEPAAPEEAEGGALRVDDLDYGRFRLAPATAGPGRRGRLLPASDLERVQELGGAPEGVAARVAELRAGVADVARTRWPTHHVPAGAISGNDRVFTVSGTVDLPSDGHPHSVAVAAWPAGLTVSYRAVPRHDPRVYRLVDARLEGGQGSLLPGPVDVLVGGRLELTTPWDGSAGRGHLRIGLGAEERLRLVRNVRYKEESAGLFGGSRRTVTQIEVLVASALPSAVRIELLERVPVPADKETLTVEVTEASPVADAWKGEADEPAPKGVKAQRIEVPAGGEARAALSYAVTLGAKEKLVGGDHRG